MSYSQSHNAVSYVLWRLRFTCRSLSATAMYVPLMLYVMLAMTVGFVSNHETIRQKVYQHPYIQPVHNYLTASIFTAAGVGEVGGSLGNVPAHYSSQHQLMTTAFDLQRDFPTDHQQLFDTYFAHHSWYTIQNDIETVLCNRQYLELTVGRPGPHWLLDEYSTQVSQALLLAVALNRTLVLDVNTQFPYEATDYFAHQLPTMKQLTFKLRQHHCAEPYEKSHRRLDVSSEWRYDALAHSDSSAVCTGVDAAHSDTDAYFLRCATNQNVTLTKQNGQEIDLSLRKYTRLSLHKYSPIDRRYTELAMKNTALMANTVPFASSDSQQLLATAQQYTLQPELHLRQVLKKWLQAADYRVDVVAYVTSDSIESVAQQLTSQYQNITAERQSMMNVPASTPVNVVVIGPTFVRHQACRVLLQSITNSTNFKCFALDADDYVDAGNALPNTLSLYPYRHKTVVNADNQRYILDPQNHPYAQDLHHSNQPTWVQTLNIYMSRFLNPYAGGRMVMSSTHSPYAKVLASVVPAEAAIVDVNGNSIDRTNL